MTTSNMPILYQNIMFGLPNEYSREVFLWAVDKIPGDGMAYKAEQFAREAADLYPVLDTLIKMGMRQHPTATEEQMQRLMKFFQARHANLRMGGDVKSSVPEYHS